jgi:hypothetical protein
MYRNKSKVWQKKHRIRINAGKIRALRSIIGVKLSDGVMNRVVREEYGMKEYLGTKIEKNILRLFSHVERMDESRLAKAKSMCKNRGKWKEVMNGILRCLW